MRRTACLSVLAGVAVGVCATGVALAEPTNEPASMSSDQVRALVADMLADADTRSSLLQSSGTAGHDGHFFLASPDGSFRLNISGLIQFRYEINSSDPPPAGSAQDDLQTGFQTRRTRMIFDGHAFDNFFYRMEVDAGFAGGAFGLLDAYVGYEFDNGVKVKWGQFKSPFLREESIRPQYQLAADRSLTNEVFNQGRSQGVDIEYRTDSLRFEGAFTDGFNSLNTDVVSTATTQPADYSVTGRVEFLGSGSWDQFKDFTSPMGSDFAWMIGAAAHYQNGVDAPGVAAIDEFSWTVDASVEGDGWNLYGAFIGNSINNNSGALTSATGAGADEFGAIIQAGVYLTEKFETFGRWDVIVPDTGAAFNTVTGGVNYYIHGHAAKFTLDFQYFLDDPASSDFVGALGSAPGSQIGFLGPLTSTQAQYVFRAQFQLLF